MEEKKARAHGLLFWIECALFAAILCILSPITVPIGPVPVTLATFAVMLSGVVLGWEQGVISVLVYILLGICGMPVFSGGGAGFGVVVGPTGGYLWSYLFMAAIAGLVSAVPVKNYVLKVLMSALGCVLGTAVCYFCGTVQFMAVADYSLKEAMAVCVLPFIPFDLIKIACAAIVGVSVREILKKQGFLNKA